MIALETSFSVNLEKMTKNITFRVPIDIILPGSNVSEEEIEEMIEEAKEAVKNMEGVSEKSKNSVDAYYVKGYPDFIALEFKDVNIDTMSKLFFLFVVQVIKYISLNSELN